MGLEIFERGELPRWARVRQHLYEQEVQDVASAVAATFERVAEAVRPGMRVAVGAGSRGIDRYAQVVRAVCIELRRRGADPFVVPAMGSHGGATAKGQAEVLAHYGVTEPAVGAPIRSSMETVKLGEVEPGVSVYLDRLASEADLIIPINRVKPHTDFHGPNESGLMKMIAIGLGKQRGADTFHHEGFDRFAALIPAVARMTMARKPVLFGIALVENGLGRLAVVEAVPAALIESREHELLELARAWMPRLPGPRIDVLILDRLGKDISGIGADSNVINRYYTGVLPFPPSIQRIIVRDLTDDTEGNASGLGQADVALRHAVQRVDPLTTYMNCVTAKTPEGARLPLTVENDRQALYVALACCVRVSTQEAAIVRVADTKHLDTLLISEPYLEHVLQEGRATLLDDPRPMTFDAAGMFAEGLAC